jgi:TolA-binding protein
MHEYDLEEIKREIVEGRSLTIKSNNLINALSADLKSIAKRQQLYERRMLVNSSVTYVVTVVVILFLTKIALDAQVSAVRSEGRDTSADLAEANKELMTVRRREEAQALASREAAQLYKLLFDGKRREFLHELPRVAALDLSPTERAVFEEAGQKVRRELSQLAYLTGIEHARAGRYHEAAQSLRESVELDSDGPNAAQAQFELARAYRSLDQQKNSIFILMKLADAAMTSDVLDEASLLLAECQADVQLYNDAKATLRTFLRRFPDSPLKLDAQQMLSDLNLKH